MFFSRARGGRMRFGSASRVEPAAGRLLEGSWSRDVASIQPTDPRAGEPSGLQATMIENWAALLRFLRARGAGDAAEDLLQELWFRASSAASGTIADPLAYLYRAANNLMLDHRRSELRARSARRTGPHRRAVTGNRRPRSANASLSAGAQGTDLVFRSGPAFLSDPGRCRQDRVQQPALHSRRCGGPQPGSLTRTQSRCR